MTRSMFLVMYAATVASTLTALVIFEALKHLM